MSDGFGISFYGFFVFAALWCVGYFAWALAANRRAGERPRRAGSRDEDGPTDRQDGTVAAPPADPGGRS